MIRSTFSRIEKAMARLNILNSELANRMRAAILAGDTVEIANIAYEDSRRCFACDQETAYNEIIQIAKMAIDPYQN